MRGHAAGAIALLGLPPLACSAVATNPPSLDAGLGGASISTTTSGLGGTLSVGGAASTGDCAKDLAQSTFGEKANIGCEHWAAEPPFYENGLDASPFRGPCYAVFVVNTWDRPAKLTVERGGVSLDVTAFGRIPKGVSPNLTYEPIPATGLPRDEVAILFLSHRPGAAFPGFDVSFECPVPPAVLDDAAVSGSGRGAAFHIVSDTPITAYDVLPFGGARSFFPSASSLLPKAAWGENHVALAPPPGADGKRWLAIVGGAQGTTVTLAPRSELPGGSGLPALPKGQSTTVTVGAGEILQWLGGDPTGTIIEASAPIGVLAGATALTLPSVEAPGGEGTDAAHQPIPAVKTLGHEYVAGGIVSRLFSGAPETVRYLIMGLVDGTTLTYDPPLPGAPAALAKGQLAAIDTPQIFTIRAQDKHHPFVFTQTMPGAPEAAASKHDCGPPVGKLATCFLGDEEWLTLLAPPQFLTRYLFFFDPSFATTSLVITRVRGPNGFSPVSIDCLGGEVQGFSDVGAEGRYQVAQVDLVRASQPYGKCHGARVEARSEAPFGVVVWGTDRWASYGYPAGGQAIDVNDVVVKVPQ